MREANLIILDEPTSSLDAKAEYDIFKSFIDMSIDKISILITHRFSNIKIADKIIVIDQGKLDSHGSHDYLMENSFLYRELYQLQKRML